MENTYSSSDSSFRKQDAGQGSGDVVFMTEKEFSLPHGYGDNKIVLMVRDPWTFYAYWETRKDVEERVRQQISAKGLGVSKSLLRVYDVTGLDHSSTSNIAFDFGIDDRVKTWYVHCEPEKDWVAEIGLLCTNGEFYSIARSNVVRTPANRVSDILDEEWMCPDELYHKMFSTSREIGRSSQSIKELVERYLRKWLSSGGVSSGFFGSASFFIHRKR
ncbi:MAG: DUF4912 domain-containing protein [Candidatus Omnitrophica bacterium]|nr:DUF4912 domain-containing protein [Candidatus Omnitrophota bacterium]